jgi:hypothetical protein
LADPPEYLHLVHQDAVWRVFEVQPAPSLTVDEGATMTDLGIDHFTVSVTEAGDRFVNVRFSPWFRVTAGDACVFESDDGWVVVRARSAGAVRVSADLSVRAVFDHDGDC